MKVLYILLFVLAGLKPAISDSTLIFKHFSDKSSQSRSYFVQNNTLRLLDEHSDLFNIYNSSDSSFTSHNINTGKISRIDPESLKPGFEVLNKQRMDKLNELEKQLKTRLENMSEKELKASQSLLNQLKYPEFYGAHTFLKTHKTKQTKSINGIHCNVYEVMRKNNVIKKLCIADNQSLKLDENDYNTLLNFQYFNYSTQTRLLLAQGKTDFTQIDFKQEKIDGIPIEIINTLNETEKLEMLLINVSHEKLDKALFIPTKP